MVDPKEIVKEFANVGNRLRAMRADVRRSEQDIIQAANAAFKASKDMRGKGIEAVAHDMDIAEKEIADAMIDMIRGFYDLQVVRI